MVLLAAPLFEPIADVPPLPAAMMMLLPMVLFEEVLMNEASPWPDWPTVTTLALLPNEVPDE